MVANFNLICFNSSIQKTYEYSFPIGSMIVMMIDEGNGL